MTCYKFFSAKNLNIQEYWSNRKHYFLSFILGIFLFGLTAYASHIDPNASVQKNLTTIEKPSIAVSIKPIYGLVVALTKGLMDVHLLNEQTKSGHTFMLSSKEIELLSKAKWVVWCGKSYELMIEKTLKNFKEEQIITLEEVPGISLLTKRTGSLFPSCAHGHFSNESDIQDKKLKEAEHLHQDLHAHSHYDGHFWLDITNIKICIQYIAQRLSAHHPELADRLMHNKLMLLDALDKLEEQLLQMLEPIKGKVALTDHDSLQYFEKNYGFSIRGALINEEALLSLKHVKAITDELDANVDEKLISTFLYTKVFKQRVSPVLEKLIKPYGLNLAGIDYEGATLQCDITEHDKLYQAILITLAKQLLAAFQIDNTPTTPTPLVTPVKE